MSSLITIAGSDGQPLDVSEARLVYPLTGAAHFDLFVASPDDLTGAVTVTIADSVTWHMTVIDGGPYVEALQVRVLAGAGGWNQPCTPKFYQGATLGFVLGDMLQGAGETLSTASDATIRNTLLGAFASTSGTLGANVRALMAYAAQGTGYRFLPDGSFWIGPETWPAFAEDYQVTTENPTERRLDVGAQVPTLKAGETVVRQDGSIAQLSRVEWAISVKAIRARGWWGSSAGERLAAAETNVVNAIVGRRAVMTVDACGLYWGKVVKVSGAMLDVQLDSEDIASPTGIPLLVGAPGALTLAGGERVLVGFRNGDPSQPYVFGIEQGTSAQEATIAAQLLFLGKKSGSQPVALDGDSVNCGTLTLAVAAGVLSGTYVDPFGTSTVIASGTPILLRGRIGSSATQVYAI